MSIGRRAVTWLMPLLLVLPLAVQAPAQEEGPPAGTVEPSAVGTTLTKYSPEQLSQMLAPIALYPDQLVAQILMASTFPDQIVQANGWLQDPRNAALKGDALVNALTPLPWDPSVKSIAAFPQIMKLLNDNIDLTQALGFAFANQQGDVWQQIQALRAQAYRAGNLRSNEHIVVSEDGPNYVIAPANPEVLVVPYYNPAVVYGPWLYPAYPPVFFPPVYFGIGPLALGVGWGWGPAWPIYGPLWGWCGVRWGLGFGGPIFVNNVFYSRLAYNHVGWRGGAWAHTGGIRRPYGGGFLRTGAAIQRPVGGRPGFGRGGAGGTSRGAGFRPTPHGGPGQGVNRGGVNRGGQGVNRGGVNRGGQGVNRGGVNRGGQGVHRGGVNRGGQGVNRGGVNRGGQGVNRGGVNRGGQGVNRGGVNRGGGAARGGGGHGGGGGGKGGGGNKQH